MILLSCLLIAQYGQALYSSYNVYLTQGETYCLPLNELYKEQILNFTIQDCPDNVQLFKALNLLSEQNNNQTFISISYSFPYQLLITQAHVLNQYYWNSTYLNLTNYMELPQQTCLNALLFQDNLVIIDCYNLTNLIIYVYQENIWSIVYSELIEQIPKKTDFKQFISNSINFILYAQYYEDNQILTQFYFSQDQLQNFSIWTQPFINFIVTNKLQSQNTIYLWNNQFLYILNVTEYGLQSTNIVYFSQIIDVLLFNPQNMFYQCDKLLIIAHDQSLQFQVCNQNTMIQEYQNQINFNNFNYISQAFLSNQFLILQLFDLIEIYEIIDFYFKLIGGLQLNSSFSQVSFDYNSNQLFIFSDSQIVTYLVDYPKIKFESDQNSSNYLFILQGSQFQINQTDAYKFSEFNLQLNVTVLLSNDNNTYLTNNISNQIVYTFQNQKYAHFISQYSGSLLIANFSLENSSLGKFCDTTFQQLSSQNQSLFQNLQFLNKEYAVGIINNNISLIHHNDQYNIYIFQNFTISSQINVKNNQIQGYYLFQQAYFGVQINSQQLFICDNCQYQQMGSYILTFQPFQQFYLLFQQIVLLLKSNTIEICNFTGNCTNLQINNDIQPVGIALNQQLCSSTLFINNNHESIIVGQITSSNTYIIFSQIDVKIQVQEMNIVNNRLILSYHCQQNQFICFKVWNVANLNSPFFEKNLRSIQNSNNTQFFADNLFYYVQTNDQIYVYNPTVLEHSSLFYTFNYNGSYFTTTTTQDMAFISFNSQFYSLSPILVYSYQTTINMFQNDITLWSNTYNVSVSSQIGTQNIIDYPSNKQIIIFNDFLNIQSKPQTYNISQNHVTLTQDNITFSGQVGWYSIICDENSQYTVINVLKQKNDFNFNKLIIAVFNQQVLSFSYNNVNSSNFFLQILNLTQVGNFIQASLNTTYVQQCYIEFALMNSQYIFLFCYQINYQSYNEAGLFRINITNQSLGEMTYLTNINDDFILDPILQDDILYILYPYQIKIYYINLKYSYSILTLCQLISFQSFVYQYSNYFLYTNIYTCKNDSRLYYQFGKRYLQEDIWFDLTKHMNIQDYFDFDFYIVGLLKVSQYKNKIVIICFTNQISIIIRLIQNINESNFSQSNLIFNRLLYYSPPLVANKSLRFIKAVNSTDLVFVQYRNENIYATPILILYNISGLDFILGNQEHPILPSSISQNYMENIITLNNSYGFINCFDITCIISNLKIDINISSQITNCILTAYNLMNKETAQYNFYFSLRSNFFQQKNFGLEYALLATLIVIIVAAVGFLWYKMKDQNEQFGLEEFEGLEIETFK